MTPEECYKSYRAYERFVDAQVRGGHLSREDARRYLAEAKKNYKRQNLNREQDAARNRERTRLHV